MFMLDNTWGDGEQAGNVRTQQQASYSGANIDGPFVLYMRGAEFNNASSSNPSGFYSDLFQGDGDGNGNLTINQSYTDDDGTYSASNSTGGPTALSFDSAHPGRATFQLGSDTAYLYLFNNSTAFELRVKENGSLDSGWFEPQTQTTFTDAALAGNYVLGELPLLNGSSSGNVGEFVLSGSGAINGSTTAAGEENLSWDQSISMIYSWDTTAPGTGTFLVANGTQQAASCAVISSTKFVCTLQADPAPSIEVMQQ
jgi:hypothetical protein